VNHRATLDAAVRTELDDFARRGLARRPLGPGEGIDLLTNDYLGLRRDPRVAGAAARVALESGVGAAASRLLGGDHEEHRALEADFAAFQGEEAAVLFPSGTAANVGLLSMLLRPDDLAVCDAWNHASLVDGVRLSRARKAIVPHGDVDAVEAALVADRGEGRRYVVVEGVHGMEGDAAPLRDLADVCRRRDALLVVDEAHSVGLLGRDGAGSVATAECADVVAARVNPCGKALAGAGGVVTTSAAIASLLVHRARSFVFTTALPPPVAAGVREALAISRAEPWRRERALRMCQQASGAFGDSRTPGGAILPWVLGAPDLAVAAAERLRAHGFSVRAVRPPTVPEGTSRVRLSFHADLSDADFSRLLDVLLEVAVAMRAPGS
jgi:8-amino-7-oxononanoate synthase